MRLLVLASASFSLSLALALAVLLVPAPAWAQGEQGAPGAFSAQTGESPHAGPTIVYTRAPQPAASSWDTHGLDGLEFELFGGPMFAGGNSPVQAPTLYPTNSPGNPTGTVLNPASCPAGQSCTPYGPDPFGVGVKVGWRFMPQLSAGLFFSYASYEANNGTDTGDAPDFTSNIQRAEWVLGVYGRYYLTTLHPRLQPWVQLGVGFSYDNASYQRPLAQATNGQPETGDYNLNNKGIAIPVSIGLDWRLAPVFSVGPWAGYQAVIPLGGCVEVDVDNFSTVPGQNTCDSSIVKTSYYGVVMAGIFAKVTFGPARQ